MLIEFLSYCVGGLFALVCKNDLTTVTEQMERLSFSATLSRKPIFINIH